MWEFPRRIWQANLSHQAVLRSRNLWVWQNLASSPICCLALCLYVAAFSRCSSNKAQLTSAESFWQGLLLVSMLPRQSMQDSSRPAWLCFWGYPCSCTPKLPWLNLLQKEPHKTLRGKDRHSYEVISDHWLANASLACQKRWWTSEQVPSQSACGWLCKHSHMLHCLWCLGFQDPLSANYRRLPGLMRYDSCHLCWSQSLLLPL